MSGVSSSAGITVRSFSLKHNVCAILVAAANEVLLQRLGKPSLDRWERHILRTLAR